MYDLSMSNQDPELIKAKKREIAIKAWKTRRLNQKINLSIPGKENSELAKLIQKRSDTVKKGWETRRQMKQN